MPDVPLDRPDGHAFLLCADSALPDCLEQHASNKVASSLQPAAQDGLKLNPDGNERRGLSYVCWQLELWQNHIVQPLVEALSLEALGGLILGGSQRPYNWRPLEAL